MQAANENTLIKNPDGILKRDDNTLMMQTPVSSATSVLDGFDIWYGMEPSLFLVHRKSIGSSSLAAHISYTRVNIRK